jgi:hypothetical protein
MFVEALKFLAEQAEKASVPFILKPEAEPDHIYYINGDIKVAKPQPRLHTAADLSAIVTVASDLDENVEVWYSAAGVVCILDADTRRDHVVLPLAFSPQLKEILSWGEKSKPFGQRELILKLRTMFKRSLDQSPGLLDLLRSLKFSSSSVTGSTVGSNKSSVGKSIEAEVTGAAALPDEFWLNVPVFAGGSFRPLEAKVDVAIEMDAVAQTFVLHPVPGTVAQQVALAEGVIGETLRAELKSTQAKVYYGNPNTAEIAEFVS